MTDEVAPTAPSRPTAARGALTGAMLAFAVLANVLLFRALDPIPNEQESVERFIPLLLMGVASGALLLVAAIGMAGQCGYPPARRAAKFATVASVLTFFLWFAPVPFGVQRYPLVALLLISAGLFLLAGVSAAVSESLGRADTRRSTGPALALGALCMGALGMVLLKMHSIAREAWID